MIFSLEGVYLREWEDWAERGLGSVVRRGSNWEVAPLTSFSLEFMFGHYPGVPLAIDFLSSASSRPTVWIRNWMEKGEGVPLSGEGPLHGNHWCLQSAKNLKGLMCALKWHTAVSWIPTAGLKTRTLHLIGGVTLVHCYSMQNPSGGHDNYTLNNGNWLLFSIVLTVTHPLWACQLPYTKQPSDTSYYI